MTNEDAVDRAIQHIVGSGSLDDIFRPPFLIVPREFEYLSNPDLAKHIRADAIEFLKKKHIAHLHTPEKFNIPKSRYAYRHASLIDVGDLVKFTALALLMTENIEKHRIAREKNYVFSYRYNKTGAIFSKTNTIDRFRQTSMELSKQKQYDVKVEADISNFYDRLNIHRLESVLVQIGCDPDCIKLMNEFLLYWAERNSFGLPVGCDASRILAEAALINVDNGLLADGIRFVRYVDDIRMFAGTYAEAHAQLNCLVTLLDREGLFLNTLKTKILPIAHPSELEKADAAEKGQPAVEGFQKIDVTEKIPAFVVTGGRYPKISKTYKFPGVAAVAELQKINLEELLKVILNNEVTESALGSFVKAYIYKDTRDLDLLFEVIYRYIHMCGYVIDALLKEAHRFSDDDREYIAERFERFYFENRKASYYDLMIARLLTSKPFQRPGFVGKGLVKMSVTVNPVFLQQFVLIATSTAKRPDLLTLRAMYQSQHTFVRRAIFHAYTEASDILPSEKKAWCKTLAKSESDELIKRQANKIAFNK